MVYFKKHELYERELKCFSQLDMEGFMDQDRGIYFYIWQLNWNDLLAGGGNKTSLKQRPKVVVIFENHCLLQKR